MAVIKQETQHIKVPREIMDKVRLVSVKEARTITQVLQLAIREIADRGWTDILDGKKEAAKAKRL